MVRVQNEVPGVLAKGAGPVLALVTQRLQLGEQARVEAPRPGADALRADRELRAALHAPGAARLLAEGLENRRAPRPAGEDEAPTPTRGRCG